ncbi:MAG: CCA tRNA nucleotidyltransferase [Gemmatimonadetes bacterium]|nr:CCA tRNA nucleotidyltransferase [Gemmatimonadota bacterium]
MTQSHTRDQTMDLHPPAAVREIAERLERAGFETWAVGGAVRDAVLALPAGDWDLATRARPQEVRRLFRRTAPIGIEHGTVGVLGRDGVLYEVTTFRRDVETFGRHAVVAFADTIEEDLARRDFTFNALAWRPSTGELRDPFGGLDDLHAGRLRTVGRAAERFAEDYLRVLRALRFAGHFRLAIAPETWRPLVEATAHLPQLSAERIREELWKILSNTPHASAPLSLYAASGVLAVLYPELDRSVGAAVANGRGDAWALSLRAVDALPRTRPLLRVAALLHALGSDHSAPRAPAAGTAPEVQRAERAAGIMRRLKASNQETERVARLVAFHTAFPTEQLPAAATDADVRRWLRDVGTDLVPDLVRLRFAFDRAGAGPGTAVLAAWARRVRRVLGTRPPLELSDLAIGGEDLKRLGLAPGPRMGEVLRTLLDRVVSDPSLNTRERLLALARQELER